MEVVLGADVGTSGLKLVALADDGAVLAEVETAYEPDRPAPGRAESDVGTWVAALDDALGQLPDVRVRGLGLSGQMHGAVLVDDAGRPLHPALLWPDERAAAEVGRWRDLPAADRAALANPVVAGMTGPLAAWLAAHEPAAVDRAATLLLPKDAVRAALVPGSVATDRSDASATLLWDVPGERWSAAAVGAAGLPARLLPEVRPADEVVGTAELPGGGEVPVVVGGADTALALLAAGGGAQLNLGTGAQLLAPGWVPEPVDDPPVHGYADAADGWYRMAALRNAGSAWAWVCRVLGLSWTELFAAAAAVPAGAHGVGFRPFLAGERGGVAGPADRASWTGLGPGTTREDLARAAVEGVVFAVAAASALLDGAGDGELLVTGGGARAGVVPRREARPPVEPRADPALGAAFERWAGVEPAPAGHR